MFHRLNDKGDNSLTEIPGKENAARIFLPRAIYENIDIVFIEFYGIH